MVRKYHQLNGHEFEQTQMVEAKRAWCAAVHGVSESERTGLRNSETKTTHDATRIMIRQRNLFFCKCNSQKFMYNLLDTNIYIQFYIYI